MGWGFGAVGGFAGGKEGRASTNFCIACSSSCRDACKVRASALRDACSEDSGRGRTSSSAAGTWVTVVRSDNVTGEADVPVATDYTRTRDIAAVPASVLTAAAISTSNQREQHSEVTSSSCVLPATPNATYLPQLANRISHSLGHINKSSSSSKASSRRTCIWPQWIASKWITSTARTCQLLSSAQVAGRCCDCVWSSACGDSICAATFAATGSGTIASRIEPS